jgi:zinc protease
MKAKLAVAVALLLFGCGPKAKSVPPPPEWTAPAAPEPAKASFEKQVDPLAEVTPLDPNIKVGKLSNGLTYYVMKHKKPEQRASLWLAVNAGSVQEDDDQRGLAHFVEHMAFNGTKRYPKQAIIDYVEKAGMKFGPDVNAYTSFDQTVYMLTVPTDDQKVMHTGLDILRDWAGDVSFDPVEVDKERGVVLEEWRLGRGAFARIDDKQWPVIFQGSKYGVRLPIGEPKILETAKRDTLVRFYKDWYRPDVMAIIAVGDFDPAAMEAEIKAKFDDLANPKQERPRTVVPVPHDHDTAITMATDPEMPFTSVTVYDKLDRRPEATRGDYRRTLVENLYHTMLGGRLEELGLEPDAPFLYAGSYTTSFARSSDLFLRSAQAKQGKVSDTLAVLFREIARVEKHGFIATELGRARKSILSNAENSAAEWEKTHGDQIADEMTRNFFEGEQMPGRHYELAMTKALLPTITLDELNQLARTWGGEKGRVVALSGPSTVKLPSETEVRQLIKSAVSASVEPWNDGPGDRPLIANPPAPGKVVATTKDDAAGTTVWTLSNGVRVIVKPTTFQNDEITFEGWQLGGSSLVPDKDFVHARYAGAIVGQSGAGDFSPVALRKLLAGKVVNVWVSIDELTQSVSGSARPSDLETALQLTHLRMTAPRKDAKAFNAWKQDQLEWVKNRKLMPEVNFFDEMTAVQTNNHLRRRPATPEMIEKVDADKALAIYKQRFADANGFTFVFVGNVDPATLQPLVEMYLGGLPAKGRTEKWKDIAIKYPTSKLTKTITAGTEPKSFVSLTMNAADKWTRDNERDAKILSMILKIRLREVLREDMGGVYGVQVSAFVNREPTQRRGFRVFFGCKPDNVEALKQALFDEVGKIAKQGIGPTYLEKVSEQLRRQHEVDLKENSWWLDNLHEAYYFGDKFEAVADVNAIVKRVTSDHVKAAARKFFDPNHYVFGVMKPKQ